MTLQARSLALPYWFGAALMAIGIVMVLRLKSVIKGRSTDTVVVTSH